MRWHLAQKGIPCIHPNDLCSEMPLPAVSYLLFRTPAPPEPHPHPGTTPALHQPSTPTSHGKLSLQREILSNLLYTDETTAITKAHHQLRKRLFHTFSPKKKLKLKCQVPKSYYLESQISREMHCIKKYKHA